MKKNHKRVCVKERKDCLEGVRGKKYQDGRGGATDEASCTRVVAGVQAMSHPSESKQRVHVKRLGCGRLPVAHQAQFTPAVRLPSRMVCFTRTKWDGERCEVRCGRRIVTHHWAVIVGLRLSAPKCEAAVYLYARADIWAALEKASCGDTQQFRAHFTTLTQREGAAQGSPPSDWPTLI